MKNKEIGSDETRKSFYPLRGHERWVYPLGALALLGAAGLSAYQGDYLQATVHAAGSTLLAMSPRPARS